MFFLNRNASKQEQAKMWLNWNVSNIFWSITGHVAATREQLLLQTQKLASRRSEKPPKLPPRDNIYHPNGHHDIPKPDYDDINEDDRLKAFRVKSDKGRDLNKKYGTYFNSNSRWI